MRTLLLQLRLTLTVAMMFVMAHGACTAQAVDVTAHIELTHQGKQDSHLGSSNVVVWLTPLQDGLIATVPAKPREYTLTQKDKQFIPHLLVVPTGSSINFPNLDPFFHNVFSLFNGKRFDLGLYQGHTHRVVQFDREGISFIFCNIHPDMGAVVVSLSTPFYAVSTTDGAVFIRNVPPGKYRMNVWAENVSMDSLNKISHSIEISPQSSQLGTIQLHSSGDVMSRHLNKFGENYDPTSKSAY